MYINSRAKLRVPTKLLISLPILFLLDAFVPVMRSNFGRTGIKTAQMKYGNQADRRHPQPQEAFTQEAFTLLLAS